MTARRGHRAGTLVTPVVLSPLQAGDVLQFAFADLSEVAAPDEIHGSGGRKRAGVWLW